MNDDLILACDKCGTQQRYRRDEDGTYWLEHCGHPMRLVNLTDRDGNAVERAKAAHPSNGGDA